MQNEIRAYAYGPSIFDNHGGSLHGKLQITDLQMIDSIKNGHRGLSPEIKIKWFQCSICKKNNEECTHEEGKFYDDQLCQLIPRDIEFLGLSIVKNPKDERAKITDLLIIENKKITWYGFPVLRERMRFENIQSAHKDGLISENNALKISTYFCSNLVGSIIIKK